MADISFSSSCTTNVGSMNFEILSNKDGSEHTSQLRMLTFQFKLYDKDGSGSVELAEMIEILVMIYQVSSEQVLPGIYQVSRYQVPGNCNTW